MAEITDPIMLDQTGQDIVGKLELIKQAIANQTNVPIATQSTPGIVKPGADMSVSADGTLNIGDTIARQANLTALQNVFKGRIDDLNVNLYSMSENIQVNSFASTALNTPNQQWGVVTTYKITELYGQQIASDAGYGKLFTRSINNGIWNDWEEIALKSTMPDTNISSIDSNSKIEDGHFSQNYNIPKDGIYIFYTGVRTYGGNDGTTYVSGFAMDGVNGDPTSGALCKQYGFSSLVFIEKLTAGNHTRHFFTDDKSSGVILNTRTKFIRIS